VKEMGTAWLTETRFPPVTTTKIRLVAATKMDTELRISELRFAFGATPIPCLPSWHSAASDNPWELHYAFDGIPASWWTSGRYVEPGMWLEVDFGVPVTLDRILMEQNEDQRWISLAPSAWLGGRWQALDSARTGRAEPPHPALRREVRDQLNRTGVHWILIPDGAYGADDLRDRAGDWGVRQVGMENGFRLYSLR